MSKEIIVYGKKMCTQCSQVKLFMELNSVKYDYVDIEDSSDEVLNEVMDAKSSLGISTLPFIKVDGEFLVPSGVMAVKVHKEKLLCPS